MKILEKTNMATDQSAAESACSAGRPAWVGDTIYRLLVEVCRFLVVETFLRTKKLPDPLVMFVYANGPMGMDWGNAPGPDDPELKPLRYKRIRVTIEVEDHN